MILERPCLSDDLRANRAEAVICHSVRSRGVLEGPLPRIRDLRPWADGIGAGSLAL
jgi:hypothetical protein